MTISFTATRRPSRPEVRDTNLLAPPVEEVRLGEGASLSSGILEDLFRNNGQTVTLSGMPLELAVSLAEPVEMEEIQIVLKRKLERIVLFFYHRSAHRK